MINQARGLYNDKMLYGNFLTTLPQKVWSFATGEASIIYKEPTRREGVFQRVDETYYPPEQGGGVHTLEKKIDLLFLKYIELGVRRIGGAFCTAIAVGVGVPVGMGIKLTHRVALSIFYPPNKL